MRYNNLLFFIYSDQVVADLKRATTSISKTEEANGAAGEIFGPLSDLKKASEKSKEGDAVKAYLETIVALEKWSKVSGIATSIKGL